MEAVEHATGTTYNVTVASAKGSTSECPLYKGIGEDVTWTGQIVTKNGTVTVVRKNAVGMRWWSYE